MGCGILLKSAKSSKISPIINANSIEDVTGSKPVPKHHNIKPDNSGLKTEPLSEKFIDSAYNEIEKIFFKDGSYFLGIMSNNSKSMNLGKLIYRQGDKYEGKFNNNKYEGQGVYIDSLGIRYEGDWLENQRHGKGLEIWPDGTKYEGNYSNDMKTGNGKLKFPDNSEYHGMFDKDNIQGKGTYSNMEFSYQGDWIHNKMHGDGKTQWKMRNITYFGQYFNGLKHGIGKLVFESGKMYVGHWKFGKRSGNGIEIDEKGGKTKGYWNNGEKIKDLKINEKEGFEEIMTFIEQNRLEEKT